MSGFEVLCPFGTTIAALPDSIVVRELRYTIHEEGFRPKEIMLVTTLFDALRWVQTASPGNKLPKLVVNPYRPNRFEPRVKKRLSKPFPLMTKLRRQLKNELGG